MYNTLTTNLYFLNLIYPGANVDLVKYGEEQDHSNLTLAIQSGDSDLVTFLVKDLEANVDQVPNESYSHDLNSGHLNRRQKVCFSDLGNDQNYVLLLYT